MLALYVSDDLVGRRRSGRLDDRGLLQCQRRPQDGGRDHSDKHMLVHVDLRWTGTPTTHTSSWMFQRTARLRVRQGQQNNQSNQTNENNQSNQTNAILSQERRGVCWRWPAG